MTQTDPGPEHGDTATADAYERNHPAQRTEADRLADLEAVDLAELDEAGLAGYLPDEIAQMAPALPEGPSVLGELEGLDTAGLAARADARAQVLQAMLDADPPPADLHASALGTGRIYGLELTAMELDLVVDDYRSCLEAEAETG